MLPFSSLCLGQRANILPWRWVPRKDRQAIKCYRNCCFSCCHHHHHHYHHQNGPCTSPSHTLKALQHPRLLRAGMCTPGRQAGQLSGEHTAHCLLCYGPEPTYAYPTYLLCSHTCSLVPSDCICKTQGQDKIKSFKTTAEEHQAKSRAMCDCSRLHDLFVEITWPLV